MSTQQKTSSARTNKKMSTKKTERKLDSFVLKLGDNVLSNQSSDIKLCKDASKDLSTLVIQLIGRLTEEAVTQKRAKKTLSLENLSDSLWVTNKETWNTYHEQAAKLVRNNEQLWKKNKTTETTEE